MSDAVPPPNCPKCQQLMSLGLVIPKVGVHPEIRSFKCRACGEVLTKATDEK